MIDTKNLKATRGKTGFKEGFVVPNMEDIEIDLSLLEKSNKLKDQKLKVEKLKLKLDQLPVRKPKNILSSDWENTKMMKAQIKKSINQETKVLTVLQKESKEIILDFNIKKCSNLAKSVDYKIKDFSKLDPIDFEREKKSLAFFALKKLDGKAELMTRGIEKIYTIVDALPYCAGSYQNLKSNRNEVKDACSLILMDMGEKDINLSQYVNPYLMLGLALSAPVGMAFAANYQSRDEKVKSKGDKDKKKEEIVPSVSTT